MSDDSRAAKLALLKALEEQARRRKYNLIDELFPEEGDLSRHNYPRHMEFFRAGAIHRERLFLAANRVGKTIAGGAEYTYHLTGRYPDWWEGRRWDRPIEALAAGDTAQTTLDIIQHKLLGGPKDTDDWGSGLIPRHLIGPVIPARGVTGLFAEIAVKHVSGGWSRLKLRSYDQGRRIFQGTELDIAWMDEEVPYDVYEESLIRTMTTQGLIMLTFTPLQGLTPLVVSFLESKHEQEPV